MKALVLCNKGFEDICALEAKELVDVKAEKREGFAAAGQKD